MHVTTKNKKYKRLFVLFGLLFVFIYTFNPFLSNNLNGNHKAISQNNIEIDEEALKKAGFWNVNKIHIRFDNWSDNSLDWIQVRTGTWDDPHIIENVTVDGGGSRNCILIENTDEYFIIRNCTTYNSRLLAWYAGIQFNNVSKGTLGNSLNL